MNIKAVFLFFLFYSFITSAQETFTKIDLVLVDKSSRKMHLIQNHRIMKTYKIGLGANPKGHKKYEGDKRTPEGRYTLDFINESSRFYRSMRINYPNQQDIAQAKRAGLNPGGQIMIHGQKNGRSPYRYKNTDWTNGCIAITNKEMDEFLYFVKIGTPIDIQW